MRICAYVHIYIYILIICFKDIYAIRKERERKRDQMHNLSDAYDHPDTRCLLYTRKSTDQTQTRTQTHIYTQTHKRTQTHTQTHTQTRRFGSVQKSHAIMQQCGSTYGIADSQPRRQSRVDCNRGTTVLIIAQSQPQCGTSNTDRDREVQITNVVYLY